MFFLVILFLQFLASHNLFTFLVTIFFILISIFQKLKTKKPNDIVKISFESGREALTVNLKLANNPAVEVVGFEKERLAITPAIEAFRKSWLVSKAK
jgi:predicted membrane protein